MLRRISITYSLTSKLHPPFFEPGQAAFHALTIIFIPVVTCLTIANVALNFINGSVMPRTRVLITPLFPGLGRQRVDHYVHSQKHIL